MGAGPSGDMVHDVLTRILTQKYFIHALAIHASLRGCPACGVSCNDTRILLPRVFVSQYDIVGVLPLLILYGECFPAKRNLKSSKVILGNQCLLPILDYKYWVYSLLGHNQIRRDGINEDYTTDR